MSNYFFIRKRLKSAVLNTPYLSLSDDPEPLDNNQNDHKIHQ